MSFPVPRLKTTLQKKLCSDSVDLTGIPLSSRDVRHVAHYLQTSGGAVVSVDLSFTEMRDEGLRILLPVLSVLPKLTTLALNGNRLTASVVKDLTEAMKDPKCFSCLAWIDLGNNVDIFTMPQVNGAPRVGVTPGGRDPVSSSGVRTTPLIQSS